MPKYVVYIWTRGQKKLSQTIDNQSFAKVPCGAAGNRNQFENPLPH